MMLTAFVTGVATIDTFFLSPFENVIIFPSLSGPLIAFGRCWRPLLIPCLSLSRIPTAARKMSIVKKRKQKTIVSVTMTLFVKGRRWKGQPLEEEGPRGMKGPVGSVSLAPCLTSLWTRAVVGKVCLKLSISKFELV